MILYVYMKFKMRRKYVEVKICFCEYCINLLTIEEFIFECISFEVPLNLIGFLSNYFNLFGSIQFNN